MITFSAKEDKMAMNAPVLIEAKYADMIFWMVAITSIEVNISESTDLRDQR